jgi:hypothetical protein
MEADSVLGIFSNLILLTKWRSSKNSCMSLLEPPNLKQGQNDVK